MNGLLLIDKSQGMTSHDVVARVRRIINMRAIGHAGTLDPFATGLLILCIGQATRLSEYLIGETKTYTGRMKLGECTNTDDLDGEVIERRPVQVGPEDLQRARDMFSGNITQVPPQFSAIQIGGRRAYKMARSGETVELQARPVRIEALELISAGESEVDLRVTCSAGTYVRALARDIGETLGCGAHLIALRRVQSGPFSLQDAVTLDMLQQAGAGWDRCLLPMDRAVDHMPECRLDVAASQRFVMGQSVKLEARAGQVGRELQRVYDAGGQFIAIGELDFASAVLKPLKVLHVKE
ncbi:MAG: tRNA pseudouridine(55) synthase TruB [Chloroflexi bacterium]|nr:tRNA pseudouridine(55) synthase TruB [Chloroflexota bacterium]MCL5275958.1 tRNA pseudouridine(55) synthase TruB [Chloroflexota bacterium]